MTVALFDSTSGGHSESIFLNSFYVGINIENVLYGIELLLYFKTIHHLLRNRGAHKKSNIFYAFFSSMMLFSVTVWVAAQAAFGQKMWLPDSEFPRDPYAYWNANISVWYMEWARVQIIVLQLMTDALMVYRCRIIWNSNRVVIVPVILWVVTLTLGVLVAWINSTPGVDFHTGGSSQFSLAYWSISVFLNTVLTCLICYRVMQHGRTVQKHLGHEYASLYFAVATVVVESVLPYTLSGIAFLVALGVGSQIFAVFCSVYVLMMCISPQILIFRVIAEKAWENDTFRRPPSSVVKFSPDSEATAGSGASQRIGGDVYLDISSDVKLPGGCNRVGILEA